MSGSEREQPQLVTPTEPSLIPVASLPVAHAAGRRWWHPTLSHQHGPLVALLVSFLLGAAGAQQWTTATSMALLVTLAAFQAEHPVVQQIRRRRAIQPRLLLWAGVYGAIALGLGAVLAWHSPVLIGIAGLAVLALGIDALAVLQRRQRGLMHELIAFSAVALAAPFAWIASSGQLDPAALTLWGLCSLYFGNSVVLLKLRREREAGGSPVHLYSSFAVLLVLIGWMVGLLSPWEAAAYGVVLLKGAWVLGRLEEFRTASIGQVAVVETTSALLFLLLASLALLPSGLEAIG